jgi:hypothetical protein
MIQPFDTLRACLEARATFTKADIAFLWTAFVAKSLEPGAFLQRGGDVSRHAAFVASGCLRSYVIDAKDKEHISASAEERYLTFLDTYPSIVQRVPQRMLRAPGSSRRNERSKVEDVIECPFPKRHAHVVPFEAQTIAVSFCSHLPRP